MLGCADCGWIDLSLRRLGFSQSQRAQKQTEPNRYACHNGWKEDEKVAWLTLRIPPIFAISSVKHSSALATRIISSAFSPFHQATLALRGSLYSSVFCSPRKALDHLLAVSGCIMSRFLHLSPDEDTDPKETQGVRRRIPLKGAERWSGGIWG